MIKKFEISKLDMIMDIWLQTNIESHNFLQEEYWINNYEMVKKVLPDSEIFIYEEDVLKGFIGITERSYIAGLFVAKRFQGNGIGGQLITECKKRYSILTLDVYARNTKAIAFYKKHGFEIKHEKVNGNTKEKEFSMLWHI